MLQAIKEIYLLQPRLFIKCEMLTVFEAAVYCRKITTSNSVFLFLTVRCLEFNLQKNRCFRSPLVFCIYLYNISIISMPFYLNVYIFKLVATQLWVIESGNCPIDLKWRGRWQASELGGPRTLPKDPPPKYRSKKWGRGNSK